MENALQFSQGATMFISFYDESIIKVIIRTILEDPEMFCGMFVTDITVGAEPQFSERSITAEAQAITSLSPAAPRRGADRYFIQAPDAVRG